MKHTYKFIIAAIMAVALTACTADTGTAEETSLLTESTSAVTEAEASAEESTTTTAEAEAELGGSEETTSAEENVSVADEQVTDAATWVESFTNIIVDGIADEESGIGTDYLIPISTDLDDWRGAMDSGFILCDINLDGVPELLALNTGITGRMSCTPIDVEGNVYEDFISNIEFSVMSINDVLYVWTYSGASSTVYTRLEDRKCIIVSYSGADSITVSVSPDDNENDYTDYTVTAEDEVAEIFIEQFGSDIRQAINSEQSNLPFVEGYLTVPDVENYTADDIYACIDSCMAQYVELIG